MGVPRMWLYLVAMACLMMIIASAALAADSGNLLKNGSFVGAEKSVPPTGWLIYGQSVQKGASSITVVDADDPQKRALRVVDGVSISRGSQGEAGLVQTVPGVAGKTYRASVHVKAVPDGLADGAYLQMRFLPSNQLKQVELAARSITDFEEFSVENVAPAGTTQVRIYIWTSAPKTAMFLLRDASLVEVTPQKEESWTVQQVKEGLLSRMGEFKPGQVVPKVGLYITADDIAQARQRVQNEEWASKLASSVISEAEFWASMPDDWYRNIMPPAGSTFSYGETGCPIDGSSWPRFGAGGTADFTRPKTLRCPNGQLIKFDDPTSPYYDSGKGIEINGVRYYLRGIWNAYVVNQLAGIGGDAILQKLAYAYALTGDEKYADKAVLIMDLLATLSPTTIGPRDFATSENQVQGRLHWLTSIVHRAKMKVMLAYDLVYFSEQMHQPSPSQEGMTNAANIEKNLIMDYLFGEYDPRDGQLRTLHNHEADSVRAMLGAGLVLGKPDWIRWGVEELGYFITNTINRDGMYYETSPGYSEFSRSVFLDMMELAYNYNPENYTTAPDAGDFPARQDFAYAMNHYDDPRIRNFVYGYRDKIDAGGHRPAFGDSTMPLNQAATGTVDLPTWQAVLRFRERTSLADWKATYEDWLIQTESKVSDARYDMWALFHSDPLPKPDAATADKTEQTAEKVQQSILLPGAALSILRSETDSTRAIEFRGGPTLAHGHDDVLGFNIYSGGYHLTWDIGYGISGSPVHLGWGTRSVAHNLVVVNEGLNRNGRYEQLGPGASVTAFTNGSLVDITEMDAANHYLPADNLTTYRRTLLQVETGAGPYLVDLFRVKGGQTHDYSFHARSADVTYQGLSLAPSLTAWTLAGLSQPDASFDAPGQSWGERIIPGEYVKKLGIPGEEVGGRLWAPPPENGYGFIYSLRTGEPEEATWQATWNTNVGFKVRMTTMKQPENDSAKAELFDGLAPDLKGTTRLRYVIDRRQSVDGKDLDSLYAHLFEAYRQAPVIEAAQQLPLEGDGTEAVAMAVDLASTGGRDYILYGGPAGSVVATDDMTFAGHSAVLRADGTGLQRLSMLGGSTLEALGWTVEAVPTWSGKLSQVVDTGRFLQVDANLPSGDILAGLPVLIDNPSYKRNSVYFLQKVDQTADGARLDVGDVTFDLAQSNVDRVLTDGRITSKSPLPTGNAYGVNTDYLAGRQLLVSRSGASYQVGTVPEFTQIQLTATPAAGDIAANDGFEIRDVQVGDSFLIRNVVELERLDALTWQVRVSAPTQITPPFPVSQVVVETDSGRQVLAVENNRIELDPERIGTGEFRMVMEETGGSR